MSPDTTQLAAVSTCGLGRLGRAEVSLRDSGIGRNCYESIGERYNTGLSHHFVGAVHLLLFKEPMELTVTA